MGNLVNSQCTVIDVPDEASSEGMIFDALWQYLNLADTSLDPGNVANREGLLRDAPVIQLKGEEKFIYFMGPAFVSYLRTSKRDEGKKNNELWAILRRFGVEITQLRIGTYNRKVWYVKYDETKIHIEEPPEIDNVTQFEKKRRI